MTALSGHFIRAQYEMFLSLISFVLKSRGTESHMSRCKYREVPLLKNKYMEGVKINKKCYVTVQLK